MPPVWANGMLECWNIASESGNNLFKLLKNPSNSSFLPSLPRLSRSSGRWYWGETFFYFTGAIIPIGAKP